MDHMEILPLMTLCSQARHVEASVFALEFNGYFKLFYLALIHKSMM